MKKKLLSLGLAIIIILGFCCTTTFCENTQHDIVLILDSSGSMGGLAIDACKQSAKTFCERVLSSGTGYRIGLIVFASDVINYGFSGDLAVLNSRIEKMDASGGTNLHDAVESANDLLSSSQSASKSIVIMADGLPEHGIKEPNGIYTAADNKVYQQANAVYNLASSMHSRYDIYTLGFFHSMREENNRNFGIRFLNDLQNRGYYEASDAESLYNAFQKIVEVLLVPPLEISLYNIHTSTYTTQPENNGRKYDFRHLYEITVNVKNTGSVKADNVKTKIEPAPGMVLDEGEVFEKSLPEIGAGETKTLTWNVRFDHKAAESKYQYSVVAGADNAVGAEKYETITVPPGIASILFSDEEKYTFEHSKDNFHDFYAIRDDDKTYLDSKLSHSEKARMFFLPSEFSGSCFGLSTVAVLSKIGTLKPDLYVSGATSISEFEAPVNDIDVESLITFYHIMQKSDRYINSIEKLNDTENLKKIERIIAESDVPALVVFNWNKGMAKSGHAVIACAYETTNEENTPSDLDLDVYTHKIDVYDVNSYGSGSDENEFDIYYSSDYENWTIPKYDEPGCWGFDIKNVTANPDDYNPYSLDDYKFVSDEEKNRQALLLSNSLTEELIIKNSTGNSVTVGATEISGNLDIWSYYDAMVLSAEDGTCYSPQTYFLPQIDDYSVKVENALSNVALSIAYPGSTFTANAESLTTVDFKDEGEISIQGSSGSFMLKSTYNEGSYTIPWHTFSVSGRDSVGVSMRLDEKGYILEGDNLKNITIEAESNESLKTETISSTWASILISTDETNGGFAYYADFDDDGEYTNNITILVKKRNNVISGFFSKILNSLKNTWEKIMEFFVDIIDFFRSLRRFLSFDFLKFSW